MASRLAGAAVRQFFKVDRDLPSSEWNGIANMAGIVIGMRFMAGATSPSLIRLVYVDEMQVRIAISESGEGRRLAVLHKRPLMTGKTEFIIRRVERRIKQGREITSQYPEKIRPMRIMAGGAVLFFDGPMFEFPRIDDLFDVCHHLLSCPVLFIVTFKARVHRFIVEQLGEVGCVRVMTLHAAFFLSKGFMGHLVLGDFRFQAFVAIKTKRAESVVFQLGAKIGGMCGMATHTTFFNRFVHNFFFPEIILFIRVAGVAGIVYLRLEQFGKIGLMNTVAGRAVTGSHRPMEKFSFSNILLGMTGKTKICSRTQEHELIR
jgi:hypothetical protein